MITKEQIFDSLRDVIDPEIGINIADLVKKEPVPVGQLHPELFRALCDNCISSSKSNAERHLRQ